MNLLLHLKFLEYTNNVFFLLIEKEFETIKPLQAHLEPFAKEHEDVLLNELPCNHQLGLSNVALTWKQLKFAE